MDGGAQIQSDHWIDGGNPQDAGSPEEAPGLAERGQFGGLAVGGNIYTQSWRMSKIWLGKVREEEESSRQKG